MRGNFMLKEKISFDKILLITAECYILLPIVIFMCGWLKTVYACLGSLAIIGLAIQLYRSLMTANKNRISLFTQETRSFWISVLVVSGIWVYLSGIGGYVFQNNDYWVRNPIFHDLSTYSWPVYYDLSTGSEIVRSICGDKVVAFSYYFTWWLPVCLVAKIFNLSYGIRNLLLYLWAFLGILLIIYLICRKFQKCSWTIPVIIIAFSGLDIIPFFINHNIFDTFPWVSHFEWWATYFQYSSNTTQLFWVFNQSIPVWLTMAVLFQLNDAKCIAGILSTVFAYSPWATLGVIPYAFYYSVRGKKACKSAVNIFNILVPLTMLLVFGTFYFAGSGSRGYIGFIFSYYADEKRRILCNYLLFVFFEFGAYCLVMGRDAFHYPCYRLTLLLLFFFPLFIVTDYNFTMRASIPALFVLMLYVINYLIENEKNRKIKKYICMGLLAIGFLNPLAEINRTLARTMTQDDILQKDITSFGDIQSNDVAKINIIQKQFFIHDYQKKFFFRYLAK